MDGPDPYDDAPSAFPMEEEGSTACDGQEDDGLGYSLGAGMAGVHLPPADDPFSELPDVELDGPTADNPEPFGDDTGGEVPDGE